MKESMGSFGKKAIVTVGILAGVLEGVNGQTASLRGSKASQLKQNQEINKEHIGRIKNKAGLVKLEKLDSLVRIPAGVHISPGLLENPENCFVRPWTAAFMVRFTQEFEKRFGKGTAPQVSSAVRTIEQQADLKNKQHNHNAAPTSGPTMSSHPGGSTFDFKKRGLTKAELAWIRKVLLSLEQRGLIEATEEFKQPCFHIMVFEKYGEYAAKHKSATQK